MKSSKLIYDLGPSLTHHCQNVASFITSSQQKQQTNHKEEQIAILLATSTNFTVPVADAVYDTAATLSSAWYTWMSQQHENVLEQKLKDEAEECTEITTLFQTGVLNGRSSVKLQELENLLVNGATICGLPLLMNADFKSYVDAFSVINNNNNSSSSSCTGKEATDLLLRAWADANIDSDWFLNIEKSNNNKKNNLFGLHSVSYSVSPEIKLRFRLICPALLNSECKKNLVWKNTSNNNSTTSSSSSSLSTIRDVMLTFEDDDDQIMPGSSVLPLVKKWKEYLSWYGIESAIVQKAFVKLQKYVKESLEGVLDEDKHEKSGSGFSQHQQQSNQNTNNATHQEEAGVKKGTMKLLYTDPENALKDVDLQDADAVTLQEYKDKMNEKFKEKVLKPGDEGYEYDKRVEVGKPTARSEWDDSDDD